MNGFNLFLEKYSTLTAQQFSRPIPPAVSSLSDKILARHGDAVRAILFYGSCLRSGDGHEGLVDLYVLVDSYRSAYHSRTHAFLNKLLPPNVFYLEASFDGCAVRAKYAVLSLIDFQRGTSMRWFHSYVWGRFAQPAGLVYVPDDETADRVKAALAQAAVTFVTRVLPRVSPRFSARELWGQGLALSYRAELRAEVPGKLVRLYDADPEYYEQLTHAIMDIIPYPVETNAGADGIRYHVRIRERVRLCSRLEWGVRCVQGKLLSVLRLLKALLTFHGGVDYILWKIERHSGTAVEMPVHLRKVPLLGVCVIFWRLYRLGAFK